MSARWKVAWVAALAAVLGMAAIVPSMAQSAPGGGPAAAGHSETGLVTINPGQQHSYTFLSGYADPKARDAQITVMMGSTPADTALFDVWTPAGLQWAAEGHTDINAKAIGSGTLHPVKEGGRTFDRYGGLLQWTGGSGRPQAYVVQVRSKESSPVQYNLVVNGNYVQFPDGGFPEQASMQGKPRPTATAAASASTPQPGAAAAASTATNSPDTAWAVDGAVRQINPGQSQWYEVEYPGKLNNGAIPDGTVAIRATPYGSANFNIWTRDRLRALALGDIRAGVPVGAGSLHPFTREGVERDRWNGVPTWTNKSTTAGKFLIEVQPAGSAASSYALEYVVR